MQRHILGAIAEFERARIADRVKAGVERARGRDVASVVLNARCLISVLAPVRGLSVRETAKRLESRLPPLTDGCNQTVH